MNNKIKTSIIFLFNIIMLAPYLRLFQFDNDFGLIYYVIQFAVCSVIVLICNIKYIHLALSVFFSYLVLLLLILIESFADHKWITANLGGMLGPIINGFISIFINFIVQSLSYILALTVQKCSSKKK